MILIRCYYLVSILLDTVESDQMTELLATMWVTVPLLALFQIIRNPLFIKNWLRPIRVGLGPTSFLWTVYTAYLQVIINKIDYTGGP